MKKVPLGKNGFAIVDDVMYSRVMAMGPWYCRRSSRHKSGYAANRTHGVLHRVIWRLANGRVPKLLDHKNLDGLDCRIENLRPATQSQNMANGSIRSDNNSGFKGVGWHLEYGKWRARILAKGKRLHLGLFDTREEAAKSYNRAAIRFFGEFARLNVIPERAA